MESIVKKAIAILEKGGTILYPTDTIWGIGGDATREATIAKVYQIKKRPLAKRLIILVSDLPMLQTYISDIPPAIKSYVEHANKPTTVIYETPKNLPASLINEDGTIAIRIVKHDFCRELIRNFGKPIISTSANISGQPNAQTFQEIEEAIKQAVDYIVPMGQEAKVGRASRIVKLHGNKLTMVRM